MYITSISPLVTGLNCTWMPHCNAKVKYIVWELSSFSKISKWLPPPMPVILFFIIHLFVIDFYDEPVTKKNVYKLAGRESYLILIHRSFFRFRSVEYELFTCFELLMKIIQAN